MDKTCKVLGSPEKELTKTVMDIIKAEANKTRMKMAGDYTLHDADDLIQEGILCFYRAYDLYKRRPPKNNDITFKNYFYRSLVNTLCGILTKSYRQVNTEDKVSDHFFIIRLVDNTSPDKVLTLMEKLTSLSPKAREYVKLCLAISPYTQGLFTSKKILGPIRDKLNLHCYEERAIRREIEQTLKG